MTRLSVVIPALNEESGIADIAGRVLAVAPALRLVDVAGLELIVVDDGSTDGTWRILERLHADDPHLKAVRFKRNFGQHPAMHAGLVRARGGIVVTMDADLQNAPAFHYASDTRATTAPATRAPAGTTAPKP